MGQGESARVSDDLRQDGITDEQGWNPLPDIPEDVDDDDGSLWESRVRGEVGIDLFDRDGLTPPPPPPPLAVVLAGGLVLVAVAPEWLLVGEIAAVVGVYIALNEDDNVDDVLDDDRDDYGWDEVPEHEPAAEDYDGILENRKLVQGAIPRASPYVGGRGPRPPWWRNLPPQAQDRWVKLFRWDPYTKRYFLKWGWEKLAVLVGMEQIADLTQQLDMVIGQFTGGIAGGGLGAAGSTVGGGGPNGGPGSSGGGGDNPWCEVVEGDPDIDGEMLWCEEASPFLGYGGHTNGPINPVPPAPKLMQLVSVDGMTAMVAVLDTATGIVRHKQYVRIA